ncbi:type II toxin-antitoxin system HicB family antitoxin, partial [Escherichia coli]|nr:CopG family transcriptional regulator [Escherichia coli]
IDVDLSEIEGKQQRINISLPDVLIRRIDGYVRESGGVYKDRSHFLAQAARHELAYK